MHVPHGRTTLVKWEERLCQWTGTTLRYTVTLQHAHRYLFRWHYMQGPPLSTRPSGLYQDMEPSTTSCQMQALFSSIEAQEEGCFKRLSIQTHKLHLILVSGPFLVSVISILGVVVKPV